MPPIRLHGIVFQHRVRHIRNFMFLNLSDRPGRHPSNGLYLLELDGGLLR
jgi:hypothetical protein